MFKVVETLEMYERREREMFLATYFLNLAGITDNEPKKTSSILEYTSKHAPASTTHKGPWVLFQPLEHVSHTCA